MDQLNKYSKGFSLIELMIVLSIVGYLILLGISLTSAWLNKNKLYYTENMIKQSVYYARVAAIRNANANNPNAEVVSLCFENSNINIILLKIDSADICNKTGGNLILKKIDIPEGITIKNKDKQTVKCLAFDINGFLIFKNCSKIEKDLFLYKNDESLEIEII